MSYKALVVKYLAVVISQLERRNVSGRWKNKNAEVTHLIRRELWRSQFTENKHHQNDSYEDNTQRYSGLYTLHLLNRYLLEL